jgi:hypothetical protein
MARSAGIRVGLTNSLEIRSVVLRKCWVKLAKLLGFSGDFAKGEERVKVLWLGHAGRPVFRILHF